ncbi:MAG: prepilin-type N-terminal cleavage/methylation domain-containing protein [Syntrophobacteraceae bacterium]|jgi:prepilin-type N-terminal cleavage/methylation domain-containing protein
MTDRGRKTKDGTWITDAGGFSISDLRLPSCVLRPGLSVRGFTLLEMLVSLAICTMIIGTVMGLISESIRYKVNLKEKAYIQPVLESAAQVILADPAKATTGVVRLGELEGSPEVAVWLTPVQLEDQMEDQKLGRLFRVMLNYGSANLEFSIIIRNRDLQ